MRPLFRLCAVALLVTACGSDDDPPPVITTTTAVAPDEPAAAALLRPEDLPGPEPWEARVPLGDYGEEEDRILICGVDLRAEVAAEGGVYARYERGAVQLTNAVTTLPSPRAERFISRFEDVASNCAEPWTQPDQTGEDLTHEIVGSLPLPDVGALGAAFTVRSTSSRGESRTVVAVLQAGAAVSSITYGGPTGADLSDVEAIVRAAAARLVAIG